jgi:hypothetical protein
MNITNVNRVVMMYSFCLCIKISKNFVPIKDKEKKIQKGERKVVDK